MTLLVMANELGKAQTVNPGFPRVVVSRVVASVCAGARLIGR